MKLPVTSLVALAAFACSGGSPTLYVAGELNLESSQVYLDGVLVGELKKNRAEGVFRKILKPYLGDTQTRWAVLFVPISDLKAGKHTVDVRDQSGIDIRQEFSIPESLRDDQVFLLFRKYPVPEKPKNSYTPAPESPSQTGRTGLTTHSSGPESAAAAASVR